MNFLQTPLLAPLANPLVFQQAIIPQRGSSPVNVSLSRDTPGITDLFAGRSAPAQGRASVGKLTRAFWDPAFRLDA